MTMYSTILGYSSSRFKRCAKMSGATMIEYLVLILFLGALLYGAMAVFEPLATNFHDESAEGIFMPYPQNYLLATATATPDPSASPSPVAKATP